MKTILHIEKKEECNNRVGSGMQKTGVRIFRDLVDTAEN